MKTNLEAPRAMIVSDGPNPGVIIALLGIAAAVVCLGLIALAFVRG